MAAGLFAGGTLAGGVVAGGTFGGGAPVLAGACAPPAGGGPGTGGRGAPRTICAVEPAPSLKRVTLLGPTITTCEKFALSADFAARPEAGFRPASRSAPSFGAFRSGPLPLSARFEVGCRDRGGRLLPALVRPPAPEEDRPDGLLAAARVGRAALRDDPPEELAGWPRAELRAELRDGLRAAAPDGLRAELPDAPLRAGARPEPLPGDRPAPLAVGLHAQAGAGGSRRPTDSRHTPTYRAVKRVADAKLTTGILP